MIIFKKASDLRKHINILHPNKVVGIIPTMGALHMGHISLVKASQKECDITVVSIFVNPTQFNEQSDLDKYPRTTGPDIDLLTKFDVDILYLPDVPDIYPDGKVTFDIDLGKLDRIMEGEFRPGHFNGVAQVVYKLLVLTEANEVFMGQKDYQQIAVVKTMIKQYDLEVKLVSCPIIRNEDGLAMSSRNVRLEPAHRKKASILFETLTFAKQNIDKIPFTVLEETCMGRLNIEDFRPEYFKIIDGDTLEELKNEQTDTPSIAACTAVWAGDVRLIDNMILRS